MGLQAQKTQSTRNRIINAVISLINESGYSAASSTAIARRAGISWGAVQHHFGNKEDILLAVLEQAHLVYLQTMSTDDLHSGSLEQRINIFVDKVWAHYKSDLYFAFIEIVMATRNQPKQLNLSAINTERLLDSHRSTMAAIFGQHTNEQRLTDALLFVHRFLSGLSIDKTLTDKTAVVDELAFEYTHLHRVKDSLLNILQSA